MAVQFGSQFTISGAGKVNIRRWPAKRSVNSTFGADGETWVDGGRTGRQIDVVVWIYGGYGSLQQLLTYLETVDAVVNQRATLTIGTTTYENCRFEGLSESAPNHYSAQHSSWMFRGVAHFVQARP